MMKQKIIKCINISYLIISFFFLVWFLIFSKLKIVDYLLIISTLLIIRLVLRILFRLNYNKNYNILFNCVFLLTTFIFIICNDFDINVMTNLIILFVYVLLIENCFYKGFKQKRAPQVILLFFLIPLFANKTFNLLDNIYSILPIIGIAAYNFLDKAKILSIRNICIYILNGVLLAVVLNINIIYSLLLVILIIMILFHSRRNNGKNVLIIIFTAFIITFAIFNILNIEYSQFHSEFLSKYELMCLISLLLINIYNNIYIIKDKSQSLTIKFSLCLLLIYFIVGDVDKLLLLNCLPLLFVAAFEFINLELSIPKIKTNIYKELHLGNKINSTKKVSVVIPNYNYEKYIIERIDSVLMQKYPIYELIILDDVSTDNSVKIIKNKINEIKREYPELKVKFIPNKVNSGNVFKQWQKAFESISGDYLWICEADDSCSNNFLKNVMRGFNDKDVVISYAESLTMDEDNKVLMNNLRPWIDLYKFGKWNCDYKRNGIEEITTTMCINNTIANVSSLVFKIDKKIPYKKYLIDAQSFKLAGDWYFYQKILRHGKIKYCSKSLNYHRMQPRSVTLTTKDDVHYREICRIQDDIMNDYAISDDIKKIVKDRRDRLKRQFKICEDELEMLSLDFDDVLKKSKVKDDILLSIIIPVYNTEKYLDKCLNSVFYNLPPKTEVIIINDGTPDNSERIIKEYISKYPKAIKYIKKKNGGLSETKNVGLKNAVGRYVIYLDSDDWVNYNMYDVMLKKALLTNADIVYCDVDVVYEDGRIVFSSCTNYSRKEEILREMDHGLMAASWNKMIRRSLFDGLEYPVKYNNEDVAITPILFVRSKKTVKIDSPFYKYFQRTGSIQNNGFSDRRYEIFETSKLCFENIKNLKEEEQEMIRGVIYTNQLISILLWVVPKFEKEKRYEIISEFIKRMAEFDDIYTNKYVLEFSKKMKIKGIMKSLKNKDVRKADLLLKLYRFKNI